MPSVLYIEGSTAQPPITINVKEGVSRLRVALSGNRKDLSVTDADTDAFVVIPTSRVIMMKELP